MSRYVAIGTCLALLGALYWAAGGFDRATLTVDSTTLSNSPAAPADPPEDLERFGSRGRERRHPC